MSYAEAVRERLDTNQTAAYLRRTTATLWKWRRDGYGPPYTKIMGRVFYDLEELDAWIAEQQG
jgi:hypothetical protein